MIDKKTATIAVLCVTTVLCLGLWSNSAQEAQRLKGELGTLKDSYDSLNAEYVKIVEDYDRLETVNQGIMEKKTQLLEEYTALKSEYDSMKNDYSALATSLLNWQRMYTDVKDDYDELKSILEAGEAVAESAEWVSEDERLKVTSKLITSGTYWVTYTVRVTITNVGDEPIDKVVIFLFPYVDGKFAEEYFEYSTHSVENIYIGETYSHDFTYLPEKMTSYKVLAVAG